MAAILQALGLGGTSAKDHTKTHRRSSHNSLQGEMGNKGEEVAAPVRAPTPRRHVSVHEESDPYIQAIYKRAQSFWTPWGPGESGATAKIGPRGLPPHPTPNESLFFFRILFFPNMNLRDIYDKFERLHMLREENMDETTIPLLLSPTIEGEGNRPIYTYDQVQKMLQKYEEEADSINFRVIERFVSSLRKYILYGKKYLIWQDFKEHNHCMAGLNAGTKCFYLVIGDQIPGDSLIYNIKLDPAIEFMITRDEYGNPTSTSSHLALSDEVFLHPAIRPLFRYMDVENTSPEIKEKLRSLYSIFKRGGARTRRRAARNTRKGSRHGRRGRRGTRRHGRR